jgi:hypothetical protein
LAKKAFVYDGTNWVDIAQSTADLSGYPALATNQFGFRNKIINGDFRINQRVYTSASNLASGAYGFDRWKSTFTNTTLTFTSAPQGQIVTINSGGSVEQIIERENMPAGTYVLSWTGTATGRVYNTGATPPSYAASPILVTIDGTANVEVEFTASGGTRTLQNVQLEAGNVASAFERRPIGTELALCQRYYEKSYDQTTTPGTATETGVHRHSGSVNGSGRHYVPIRFKVEKRTNGYTVGTHDPTTVDSTWVTVNANQAGIRRTPLVENKGTSGMVLNVEDGGYSWIVGNTRGHWSVSDEL